MIRLISQFDNEKREMSLATPTCGCCSCCCCCVLSTFAVANITARSFGESVENQTKKRKNKKKIKSAKLFGFWSAILLHLYMLFTIISLKYIIINILFASWFMIFMIPKINEKYGIKEIRLEYFKIIILLIVLDYLNMKISIFALSIFKWGWFFIVIWLSIKLTENAFKE